MEAARRPVVVEKGGKDRVEVGGQLFGQDTLYPDDDSGLIKRNLVQPECGRSLRDSGGRASTFMA